LKTAKLINGHNGKLINFDMKATPRHKKQLLVKWLGAGQMANMLTSRARSWVQIAVCQTWGKCYKRFLIASLSICLVVLPGGWGGYGKGQI